MDIAAPEQPELTEVPQSEPALPKLGAASKKLVCGVSGKERPKRSLTRIDDLRPSLAEMIRADWPDLPADAMIGEDELARYRNRYVEQLLSHEHGEFTELDRQVAESIARQDTIAENIESEFEDHWTFGERISDVIANYGGSWSFILSFLFFLAVWMGYNLWVGEKAAFDVYPFILLNLVLSTIAAIQAPIIMMSQRRQESKDRLRSLNDYRVNLKAELEIRHLHEKIDHLITKQWQRLAEIQQMQLEIMQEKKRVKKRPARAKKARIKPVQSPSEEVTLEAAE